MYSAEIIIEGDIDRCLQVIGTPRKVFNPRKILPPPTSGFASRSERTKWLIENPGQDPRQALIAGEIDPINLKEWKQLHWGTERTLKETIKKDGNRAVISLQSEGSMDPLLEQLLQTDQDISAALVLGEEEAKIFLPGKTIEGTGSILKEDLQYWGFDESLQCRLRNPLRLQAGWQKDIRDGKIINAWSPWGQIDIQSENARNPQAEFLLDDFGPLDDVLLVRHKDLWLLFDPC